MRCLALQTDSGENTMMQAQQKQAPEMQNLIDTSNQFYQDLLGYKPEQTSLQSISENQWNEFTKTRGLNSNSSGIYLPRNQTAIIQGENSLNLFHEYFGHGLYCEQSLSGKKLVDLEKKLLEEEKQEFHRKQFNLKDIQKFRKQNQTFQELNEFRKSNLAQYETFAIWTEYLLSGEFGLRDSFERKYYSLKKLDRENIDSIINFSETYGNLATFYASSLARRTTPERVRRLLEGVHGSKLQDVKFALLYGSKKEFSDIDVFIVGKRNLSFKNKWLDVLCVSEKQFQYTISMFDIAVTDPLFSGELIFGNRNYVKQVKKKLTNQPIVQETIQYNFKKSEEQNILSEKHFEGSEENNIGRLYSQTYLANALALREGLRLFNKEDLLSYLHNEKLNQLKGGMKNNAT